ncbi:class I SAM-dependent methyltransferase [Nocardia carnea]|uniref:class I SAM-dependent methyltransferase n=1 Tax=Nocardia carnea TaxID=37328 RepID=UPI0024574477|nr:class I SAM-dependent methyltransferase [Nocardia carnea]
MDTERGSVPAMTDRIIRSVLGAVDVLAIFVGDRLGWYRSLVADGPASAVELATRTGTHPRYAREWLEQQAVTGLLSVHRDGSADERVFAIPAATAEVLTDEHSLEYLAPIARLFGAAGPVLPKLLDAYRSGSGVSWDELGDDAREGQADGNRPWYERRLAAALNGVPEVAQVLSAPGATVLDIGCGAGWSAIALSRAYPAARVRGVDIDAPSVRTAVANAAGAGVADRVEFTAGDAAELPAGAFDIAFAFECVHDMPRPVEVLASVRRALRPGGIMVVMDEAVAPEFAPDGDELERLMYGFSLFVCLPDGMSSPPSAGTGTVMRPATLRGYALEAGFAKFDVLPIEDFGFWRFYRLG